MKKLEKKEWKGEISIKKVKRKLSKKESNTFCETCEKHKLANMWSVAVNEDILAHRNLAMGMRGDFFSHPKIRNGGAVLLLFRAAFSPDLMHLAWRGSCGSSCPSKVTAVWDFTERLAHFLTLSGCAVPHWFKCICWGENNQCKFPGSEANK